MKHINIIPSLPLTVCLIFGALAFGTGSAYGGWQLAWSDDFTQADGSSPDPTKWGYDIGNGDNGWGNQQLEYDTSRTNNVRIQGGNLVIEADQESYGGFNYTSGRMNTKGKWSWTYGRIEARIKIPRGQGIWPAFWMLGANIDSVGWPTCGELDIMENIGKASDQGTEHGTMHGPGYSGGNGIGGTYTLPGGAKLSDDFHIYAIEWTTNQIKWFLDTNLFFTATPASLPGGTTWVFTAPQFIILNVAVGGQWPGNPDGTTVFPQQMLVDYVHVYNYVVSSVPDAPTGLTATPGGTQVVLGWSPSNGATNYNVKFSTTNGGPYTTIGSTATTGYTNTGLTNGTTYYYVVSAANSFGESTNSVQISATTTVPSANLALHKVTTVSSVENGGLGGAYAVDGNTTSTRWSSAFSDPQWIYVDLQATININRVRFYWENSYATSFQIQVSSNAVDWTSIYSTTTGPGGVQNLTGLSGTGRYVRMYGTVRKTQYGYSLWEFEVYGNIFVPTGLTATAGNQQVSLSWNAVPGATSYNVKSSTANGGPYVTIASPTTTGYTNTGLVNGTTYYYVVSQVNAVAESTNSTQVSATPVCTPPAAPTAGNNGPIWAGTTLNLTASTVSGATYSWTGPNGFTSASQNPSIVNATTNASGIYSVTATVGGCTSTAGTTTVVVNLIAAPTGLTATASNSLVTLSWNPSTAATGYNVKRSLVNGGPYTLVSGGLTGTSCNDSVVTNGTTYYYVVSAVNSVCESTNSTQVSATPVCTPPAAPTAGNNGPIFAGTTLNLTASTVSGATYSWTGPNGFTSASQNPSIVNAATNASGTYSVTATVGCTSPAGTTAVVVNLIAAPRSLTATASNSLVALKWIPLAEATGYNVKRSLIDGGPYTLVSGGVTGTSYNDSVVTNGTTYYYVVSAVNSACESTNSTQVSATPVCTPPAAPAGLTAIGGDSLVTLSWNTSSGATSYNVMRSLIDGGPYTLLSGGLTDTNCTDSVVTNETTYYYVVSAVNADCESTNSIQASAMPTNLTNNPPVLAAISNQTILAGRTLLITNSATDADVPAQTLTFSLLTAPANAAINASSGVFSWRPTIAQSPSTQTVAVVVSDNGTPILSATQSFTATVIQPAVPALNAGSITGGRYGFWINGDSGPDYTILASTNLISWNPIFTNNSPSLPCYWVDTNSAAYPARYYRTVLGP